MKWKASLLGLLVLVCLNVSAQTPAKPTEVLDGLDPVMLAQGKEVQGELQITVTRGTFKYMFATAENKALFEKDPERYEIQLGGHCARMGAPVTGNPDLYSVHKGRIYIFGSGGCKKMFDATPEKYLEPAGGTSLKLSTTSATLEKGQALLAKAVAAMGGAAKLDGLTSYREKNTTWQQRQMGEITVKNDVLLVFPDKLRHERQMPEFRDPSVIGKQVIVITPNESFGVGGPRGMFQVHEGMHRQEQQDLNRKPLSLLRARQRPGFQAVALGTAMAGTTKVEQVALTGVGEEFVLGIDPATGRIVSLTQQRRGPDGQFGQFVQLFDDYRTVNGLTLPFKVTATFDGQPWRAMSAQVEEIVINGNVEPGLFEKPKVEKQ
jgi:YHS domain-containing protein